MSTVKICRQWEESRTHKGCNNHQKALISWSHWVWKAELRSTNQDFSVGIFQKALHRAVFPDLKVSTLSCSLGTRSERGTFMLWNRTCNSNMYSKKIINSLNCWSTAINYWRQFVPSGEQDNSRVSLLLNYNNRLVNTNSRIERLLAFSYLHQELKKVAHKEREINTSTNNKDDPGSWRYL